jgi:hypothetical protein
MGSSPVGRAGGVDAPPGRLVKAADSNPVTDRCHPRGQSHSRSPGRILTPAGAGASATARARAAGRESLGANLGRLVWPGGSVVPPPAPVGPGKPPLPARRGAAGPVAGRSAAESLKLLSSSLAALGSPPAEIIKTYPARGPLQQFRLARAMPFACFRCGQEKKAKLQAVYDGDWSRRLCNGCYGCLLSVYEVAADTPADDEAAAAMAALLPSLVLQEDARAARRRTYAMALDEHLGAGSPFPDHCLFHCCATRGGRNPRVVWS